MQNQLIKLCSRCGTEAPRHAFPRRALSADGYAAACKQCINKAKQTKYWATPEERQAASIRATEVKAARFAVEPAYRRAFHLWGTTKRRTKIPPWVKITDFVPICAKAIWAGPGFVLDHIIPVVSDKVCGLHVPSNLRLITRGDNTKKGNSFVSDWD